MSDTLRILAFAGSTRKESFNRKLVHIAAAGAREAGADVTEIDLRDCRLPTTARRHLWSRFAARSSR
jgi:NAD(P)H-dependent FMN reductase